MSLTRLSIAYLIAIGLGLAAPARAASVPANLTIGFAAPLRGEMAPLGQQMQEGVEAAAANFPGATITLETDDAGCSAEGGARAGRNFVSAKADIVVGFLCTEAIEAAMPILKKAGIPVITAGVRTESLTDNKAKTGWPVWRMAPRADDESKAVDDILTEIWRSQLFAIVDDGTIYGRELAENLRLAAENKGLKPVFVDTYRPDMDNQIGLVDRLKKAGATHVFVGGGRRDIAIIERDAAKLGAPLVVAGGEALRDQPGDIPLQPGTLMIGLPDWTPPADSAIARQLAEADVAPEGYVLPGYAVVQVAADAALDARKSGKSLDRVLAAKEFDTVIGKIGFSEKGDLQSNPFRLFRYDGQKFVEVE